MTFKNGGRTPGMTNHNDWWLPRYRPRKCDDEANWMTGLSFGGIRWKHQPFFLLGMLRHASVSACNDVARFSRWLGWWIVACITVWNIFHTLGIIIPIDWYYSEGLKPPTRQYQKKTYHNVWDGRWRWRLESAPMQNVFYYHISRKVPQWVSHAVRGNFSTSEKLQRALPFVEMHHLYPLVHGKDITIVRLSCGYLRDRPTSSLEGCWERCWKTNWALWNRADGQHRVSHHFDSFPIYHENLNVTASVYLYIYIIPRTCSHNIVNVHLCIMYTCTHYIHI